MIRNPDGLIGRHRYISSSTFNLLFRYQIMPIFRVDQIDRGEIKSLLAGTQIGDRENALLAIMALPPNAKKFSPQLKGELRCIGMKSRLPFADRQKVFQCLKTDTFPAHRI